MSLRIKRLKPKDHAVESYVVPINASFEIRSLAEYRINGKFIALIECRYTGDPVEGNRHIFARCFMPQSQWAVVIMDEIEGIGNRQVMLTPGSLDHALVLSSYVTKPDHREVAQVIRSWVRGEMNGAIHEVAPALVFPDAAANA